MSNMFVYDSITHNILDIASPMLKNTYYSLLSNYVYENAYDAMVGAIQAIDLGYEYQGKIYLK